MSATGLALRDIRVVLDGRPVVDEVSLDLAPGTFAALVGPNGAGKTSLLRALVGLLPYGGEARLGGEDLRVLPARERARRLAYLPQGHEAHWPLPARDIVALGRFPHGATDPQRLGPRDAAAVDSAMSATDTTGLAARSVTTLSGGERARVALARVLAVEAPVILADEPTAALDPRHQLDVMQTLACSAAAGAIAVAVTHDLGLAARFAQVVVVMEGGRIAAIGPPAQALAPDMLAAVFGVAAYRAEHEGRQVLVPWL